MAWNWLTKLTGSGVTEIAKQGAELYEKIAAGHLGKKELSLELEKIAAAQFEEVSHEVIAELGAKERIIIAELQQGDAFTKRARPAVVYSGPIIFFALMLIHYISIWMGHPAPPAPPYTEWYLSAWAGYGSVYAVGRTIEKRGTGGRVGEIASTITGRGSYLARD